MQQILVAAERGEGCVGAVDEHSLLLGRPRPQLGPLEISKELAVVGEGAVVELLAAHFVHSSELHVPISMLLFLFQITDNLSKILLTRGVGLLCLSRLGGGGEEVVDDGTRLFHDFSLFCGDNLCADLGLLRVIATISELHEVGAGGGGHRANIVASGGATGAEPASIRNH